MGTLLKNTFMYDFNDGNFGDYWKNNDQEAAIKNWRENVDFENLTLEGLCGEGASLGVHLLGALNINDSEVNREISTTKSGLGHGYNSVETSDGVYLINGVSGTQPYNLVSTEEELESIGFNGDRVLLGEDLEGRVVSISPKTCFVDVIQGTDAQSVIADFERRDRNGMIFRTYGDMPLLENIELSQYPYVEFTSNRCELVTPVKVKGNPDSRLSSIIRTISSDVTREYFTHDGTSLLKVQETIKTPQDFIEECESKSKPLPLPPLPAVAEAHSAT